MKQRKPFLSPNPRCLWITGSAKQRSSECSWQSHRSKGLSKMFDNISVWWKRPISSFYNNYKSTTSIMHTYRWVAWIWMVQHHPLYQPTMFIAIWESIKQVWMSWSARILSCFLIKAHCLVSFQGTWRCLEQPESWDRTTLTIRMKGSIKSIHRTKHNRNQICLSPFFLFMQH